MYDPDEVPAPIPAPKLWSDLPPYFEEKHKGRVKTTPYHAGSYHFPGGGGDVDASMLSEVQIREMISHYYGMITLVDEQIGRLMRKLEEYDLEQDTLIIFTSDHGELLGDHGLWLKGPYHYEGLIRVPMMWKYPARIPDGRESDALFSHVDLTPTLLELCSIRSMPGVQGVSQAAVMEGKSDRVRKDALCEFRIHHEWPALNVKTLITASHKLTVYAGYDFGELYDLATDPSEQRNLWNDTEYRIIKEELTKTLFTRLMQTEDPLPPQICDH
jgi:arylsulfatase A-like enzyme